MIFRVTTDPFVADEIEGAGEPLADELPLPVVVVNSADDEGSIGFKAGMLIEGGARMSPKGLNFINSLVLILPPSGFGGVGMACAPGKKIFSKSFIDYYFLGQFENPTLFFTRKMVGEKSGSFRLSQKSCRSKS